MLQHLMQVISIQVGHASYNVPIWLYTSMYNHLWPTWLKLQIWVDFILSWVEDAVLLLLALRKNVQEVWLVKLKHK
jgi:hypothetical protein